MGLIEIKEIERTDLEIEKKIVDWPKKQTDLNNEK